MSTGIVPAGRPVVANGVASVPYSLPCPATSTPAWRCSVDDAAQGAVLGESGSKAAPPVFAIEKHYDAEALWFHITKLVHPILTRVGLVAKFIGDDSDGGGATPCRCEGWARAVE